MVLQDKRRCSAYDEITYGKFMCFIDVYTLVSKAIEAYANI